MNSQNLNNQYDQERGQTKEPKQLENFFGSAEVKDLLSDVVETDSIPGDNISSMGATISDGFDIDQEGRSENLLDTENVLGAAQDFPDSGIETSSDSFPNLILEQNGSPTTKTSQSIDAVTNIPKTPFENCESESKSHGISDSDSGLDLIADTSTAGKFNYAKALQKSFLFFEANQSGELSPNNRIEWRSDSTLNDGSDQGIDLEGGYFDAGDGVKFGQPLAFSIGMLAQGGIEYRQAYQSAGQLDELLETVKHGTDYFLKAHERDSSGKTTRFWVQVGEGGKDNDHGYWGPPEGLEANTDRDAFAIDPQNPGSDIAGSTAGALALASELFRGVDDQYADRLLDNAKALFEFAENYRGKYSDSVPQAAPFYTSWSGFGDELAYGAAAVAKVTGDEADLTKAENYFKTEVGTLGDWASAADDQSYSAGMILAQISNDPYFKEQTKAWLDKWVKGKGNINYTEGGFAHRAAWGSVPVTSSAAFFAELYSDTVAYDQRYEDFASNQVDYILGDNPTGQSYMVGFGDNYPERTHHRGSAGSQSLNDSSTPNDNILWGAIVGGPGSASDYDYNDVRSDWVTNEVGVSYNAPAASALIQQYDNFGGNPLDDAQLDALAGVDTSSF